MFNNVGGKIKILAKVMAWIGIIACFIIGILMIASDEDTVFIGFLTIIFGSIISWASSFVLYGFGELVENSSIIAGKTQNATVLPNFEINKEQKENKNEVIDKWLKQGLITEEEYQSQKSKMK